MNTQNGSNNPLLRTLARGNNSSAGRPANSWKGVSTNSSSSPLLETLRQKSNAGENTARQRLQTGHTAPKTLGEFAFSGDYDADTKELQNRRNNATLWTKYLSALEADIEAGEKLYRSTKSEDDYKRYEATVDQYNRAVEEARPVYAQYEKDYKTYQDKHKGQLLLHSGRDYSDYTKDELDLAIETKQKEYDAFREKWGESVLSSLNDIRNNQKNLTSAGADQSDVDAVEAQKKQLASQMGIDRETLDRISYDAVQLEQQLNQLKYQQEVMRGYEVVKDISKEGQDALRKAARITNRQALEFDDALRDIRRLTGMANDEIIDLIDEASYYLNSENAKLNKAEAEAAAEKNPGWETVKSVGRQTTSGMAGTVDFLMQKAKNPDKVLDINAPHQMPGQTNTAVREKVAGDIASGDTTMFLGFVPNPTNAEDRPEGPRGLVSYEGVEMPDWLGGQNVGSFIYQAGTSALDSAVNAAIARGTSMAFGAAGSAAQRFAQAAVTDIMMGSNVARDTTTNLIKQGVSSDKALVSGLVSGAIEGFTEAVGVDNVFKAWSTSPNVWKNIAASALAEGGEEWMSNVLNRVSERIYNGNISHFKTLYYQNIDAGLSEEEALREATISIIGEDTSAILSGALSSVPMSGVAAASTREERAKMKAEAAKKISPVEAKYNEVSAANPDKTVMHPVATELTEAGYTDAAKAIKQGTIIEKILSGEDITDTELDALDLNNEAVRTVFANRTGMSEMVAVADFTRQLKREYANKAAQNARDLKATEEAAAASAQQTLEQEKEKARKLKGLFRKRADNANRRAAEAEASMQKQMQIRAEERAEAEEKAKAPVTPYQHNRKEAPPLGGKKTMPTKTAEPAPAPYTPERVLQDMTGWGLDRVEASIKNITQLEVPSIRDFVARYFAKQETKATAEELINVLSAYQELMAERGFTPAEANAIINAYSDTLTSGAGDATLNATNTKEATNGREDNVGSSSAAERLDGDHDDGGSGTVREGSGELHADTDESGDGGVREEPAGDHQGVTSSAEIFGGRGTEETNLTVLTDAEIEANPEWRKLKYFVETFFNKKLTLLKGGVIHFGWGDADGVYIPGTGEVYAVVDNPKDVLRIVLHELCHSVIEDARDPNTGISSIYIRIFNELNNAGLVPVILSSASDANGYGKYPYKNNIEKHVIEIFCDAFAGINPFNVPNMEQITEIVRDVVKTSDMVAANRGREADLSYSLANVPDTWGRTLEDLTSSRDEAKVRERIAATPKATEDLTEEEWARRHESRREAEIDRELERREKQKSGSSEDRVKPEVKRERAKAVLKAATRDQESDMHLKDLTAEEREARAAAQMADEEAAAASADRIQQLLTLVRGMSDEEQEAAIQRLKSANRAEREADVDPDAAEREARMAEAAAERAAKDAKWAEYEAKHRPEEEVVEVLTEEEKEARREEYARKRQEAYEQREAQLKQEREAKITELRNQEVPLKDDLAKLDKQLADKKTKEVPYNESLLKQARVDVTRRLAENYLTLGLYTGDGQYYVKAREMYEGLRKLLNAARNDLSDSYAEQKGTMYRETDIEDADQVGRDTENIDEDIDAEREGHEPNALAAWEKELGAEARRVKELIDGDLRKKIMEASDAALQEEIAEPSEDGKGKDKEKSKRWSNNLTLDGAAELIWRNSYKKLKGGWANAPYAQKVWAYLRAFGAPEIYNERTKKKDSVFEIAKTIIKTESVAKVPPERLALVLANAEGLSGDGVILYNDWQKQSYPHGPRQILKAAMNNYWFESNGVADVGSIPAKDFFDKNKYKDAKHHIPSSYADRAKDTHAKLVEREKKQKAEYKALEKESAASTAGKLYEDLSTAPEEMETFGIDNYRKTKRNLRLDAEDIARRIRVAVTDKKAETNEAKNQQRDIMKNPGKYIQVLPVFEAPGGLDWFKQSSSSKATRAGLTVRNTVQAAQDAGVTGLTGLTAEEDEEDIELRDVHLELTRQASEDITLSATDYEDYKNAVHELTDVFTALGVANAQLFLEPGRSPITAQEALNLMFKDSRGRPLSFANADVNLMETVASILRTELNSTEDEKTPHIDLLETIIYANEILGRDTPQWLTEAAEGTPIPDTHIADNYETEDAPDVNANATALKDVVGVEYKVLHPGEGDKITTRRSEGTKAAAKAEMTKKYGSFDASVINTKLSADNAAVRKLLELGHRVVDGQGVTDVGVWLQNAEKGAKTRGISDAALAYAIHEATLDKKAGTQVNLETLLNNAATLNDLFAADGVTEIHIKTLRKLGYRMLDNGGLTGAYRVLKVMAPNAARFNIPGGALAEAIDIAAKAKKEGVTVSRAELLESAAKLAEAEAALQEDIARDAARERQEAREWAKQNRSKAKSKQTVPSWMEDDGEVSYSITSNGDVVSNDDFDFDQFLAYADKNPDIIPDKNRAPTSVNRPVSHTEPTYMDSLDEAIKDKFEQDVEDAMKDAKATSTVLTPELLAGLSPEMQRLYERFEQVFGDGSFSDSFHTVEQAEHQLEREAEKAAESKVSSPDDMDAMVEEARKRVAKRKRDAMMRKITKKDAPKSTAADDTTRWAKLGKATENAKVEEDLDAESETEKVDAEELILNYAARTYEDNKKLAAFARGLQNSQKENLEKDTKSALRETAKRVREENSEAAHRGRKKLWQWGKAKNTEVTPAQRKKGFAKAKELTVAEKAKNAGLEALRKLDSNTLDIEIISRGQTRLDNADTYVTKVRNSQHQATYIMTEALMDRTGGKWLGHSGISVLMCLDEKGNVDETKNPIYQRYLLLKHTIDRMSIEAKARKAVLDFETKYPYLLGYGADNAGRREFGQMLTRGDEIAWEYKRLIDKALKAKNAPVLYNETENGGRVAMTAEEAAELAAQIEKENPWVVAKAERWYTWYDMFMREYVVGGSMTLEQYERMHEALPHYVPTHRVFENGPKGAGSVAFAGGSTLSDTKSTKKATGSLRDVRDVYDSVADLVTRYVKQDNNRMLHGNLMFEAMYDFEGNFADYMQFDWADSIMDESILEGGDYLDVLSAMEESERLEKAGAQDFAMLAGEEFERDADKPYKLTTWVNGKKYSMFITEGLYKGLQSVTHAPTDEAVDGIRKWARAINAPHKAFVTSLNPLFSITNLLRDLPTAAVYSTAGLKFGKFIPMAFREMTQNSDNWQSFQALGGTRNGYYWSESGFLEEYTKSKGTWAKVKGAASFLGEHSEAVTRFAEYLAGLEKFGNTPQGRAKALKLSAEVTLDFSRGGSVSKLVNDFIPFFNPAVQGLSKMIRSVVMTPEVNASLTQHMAQAGKTLGRAVIVHTLTDALLWAIRMAIGRDEDWDELSDYVKNNYYCIPIPGKPGKFIKIPKNREWSALLGTPMVMLLEAAMGEDDAFDSYLETSLRQNVGLPKVIGEDTITSMWVSILLNEDYKGSAIVPYEYDEADSEYQVNKDTTLLAKTIGPAFEKVLSPMQIDYILHSYFGSFASTLLFDCMPWGLVTEDGTVSPFGEFKKVFANMAEGVKDEVTSKFLADNRYSNYYIGKYYDTKEELDKAGKNFGVITGGTPGETEGYLRTALGNNNEYVKRVHELNNQITAARERGDTNAVDRLSDQVHSLALTAMGATDEQILEQKILSALNATGGFGKQISELSQRIDGLTDDNEIGEAKAQQAELAKMALEFYDRCMSGEIKDPKAYGKGLAYGERVAEAFSDLGNLSEEFNFYPDNPTTEKIADPDSRLRSYQLTDAQKKRHDEIYAQQYGKLIHEAANSAEYRNATPRGKAQILLDAKNDAKDEALRIFSEEVHNSNATPVFDEAYAKYGQPVLDTLIRLDAFQDSEAYNFMPRDDAPSEYVDPDNKGYKYYLNDHYKSLYKEYYQYIYESEFNKVLTDQRFYSYTPAQQASRLHDMKEQVGEYAKEVIIAKMKRDRFLPEIRDTRAEY